MGTKTLGQVAFEAYDEDRGGVNHQGNATPPWPELPVWIRDAWEVAASAVIRENESRAGKVVP